VYQPNYIIRISHLLYTNLGGRWVPAAELLWPPSSLVPQMSNSEPSPTHHLVLLFSASGSVAPHQQHQQVRPSSLMPRIKFAYAAQRIRFLPRDNENALVQLVGWPIANVLKEEDLYSGTITRGQVKVCKNTRTYKLH